MCSAKKTTKVRVSLRPVWTQHQPFFLYRLNQFSTATRHPTEAEAGAEAVKLAETRCPLDGKNMDIYIINYVHLNLFIIGTVTI